MATRTGSNSEIRYYNDSPRTPVFFEIKRRMKDVILKQRCAIKRGGEEHVLAGHVPGPEYSPRTTQGSAFRWNVSSS